MEQHVTSATLQFAYDIVQKIQQKQNQINNNEDVLNKKMQKQFSLLEVIKQQHPETIVPIIDCFELFFQHDLNANRLFTQCILFDHVHLFPVIIEPYIASHIDTIMQGHEWMTWIYRQNIAQIIVVYFICHIGGAYTNYELGDAFKIKQRWLNGLSVLYPHKLFCCLCCDFNAGEISFHHIVNMDYIFDQKLLGPCHVMIAVNCGSEIISLYNTYFDPNLLKISNKTLSEWIVYAYLKLYCENVVEDGLICLTYSGEIEKQKSHNFTVIWSVLVNKGFTNMKYTQYGLIIRNTSLLKEIVFDGISKPLPQFETLASDATTLEFVHFTEIFLTKDTII